MFDFCSERKEGEKRWKGANQGRVSHVCMCYDWNENDNIEYMGPSCGAFQRCGVLGPGERYDLAHALLMSVSFGFLDRAVVTWILTVQSSLELSMPSKFVSLIP